MSVIRSGLIEEAVRSSGEWIFVDVGFSSKAKSCCYLKDEGDPTLLTFGDMKENLTSLAKTRGRPLNLVLEAPLSVAFAANGNPVGRNIERRDDSRRYWHVGLGCNVIVATTYIVRAMTDVRPNREIRLFEGLASFKQKGIRSSHRDDVLSLRKVVWEVPGAGKVISAELLAASPEHTLLSAFSVAGMDYGVPPVVAVGG
jgi:hypothetical protein